MKMYHESGRMIIECRHYQYRWKIRTTPGMCRRFATLAEARKWAKAFPDQEAAQDGGPLMQMIRVMAGEAKP